MRIVIAEDAAVIRAGLTEILTDRGHEIVAAVGDADALLAAVASHKPDAAIVDVRMPPDHTDEGLRAAIAIRRAHPGVDDAITRVAAGGTALDPEVVTGLLSATRHVAALGALTPREHDVLALMAEGRSNSVIAERFFVSERAVEKHISNIFSKLGLPPSDCDHRRVLAVLAFLNDRLTAAPCRRRPCAYAARELLRWAARKRRISCVSASACASPERAMAASMSFRSPAVV
jgi:DNA-binding NarL/FixJ family response regulator